jgi:hypothetical protein
MQALKLSVTITLDDDIVEAWKKQKGYTDRNIEGEVKSELQDCHSPSGLMFEIKVEKIEGSK